MVIASFCQDQFAVILGAMFFSRLVLLLVGAVSVRGDAVESRNVDKRAIRPNPSNGHWIDAWASMPQLTEPANLPPAPFVGLAPFQMYASS